MIELDGAGEDELYGVGVIELDGAGPDELLGYPLTLLLELG